MFAANGRSKLAGKTATVSHDIHVAPRENLKAIAIDSSFHANADRKLFRKFARERLAVVFAFLRPAARQFPFVA